MFRSLTWKLTLAFLLVAIAVALLVAVAIRLTSAGNFDQLLLEQARSEYKANLIAYYQAHGSWEGVEEYLAQQREEPAPQSTPDPAESAGPGEGWGAGQPNFRRERHQIFGLVDAQGVVVIPFGPVLKTGTRVTQDVLARGEPVEVDGQVVGTILTPTRSPGFSPEEIAYLRRTDNALALAAGGAILVALGAALVLARTLTRPLHALTEATHRMAGGELEQEVAVKSRDEIGELAAAFNRMSREVARAHDARRQMTADVAHELRTPLTVIAGYVESMRDGALTPTPERLSVIYAEIERLQDLVGDLRTLTQADAGELKLNKQSVTPGELLQQAQATFEHQAAQKGVRLEVKASDDLPPIEVDEARLAQVLGNLLSNALRYTPAGGRIELGAALEGGRVKLAVQDTGPGIAAEDLPLIFERFYRADKARAEDNGESGLGLAIVKALVEAHGGTVAVQSTPGAGSTFAITFDVLNRQPLPAPPADSPSAR
jgi:signal transduction histidine kinase